MISKQVLDLEPQFIAWRRELHAVPELSFQEVQTTEFLLKHLRSIPGLTIEQPTKTGVVAVLRGAHPGRTIALRADIDALPIQEETDLPFASKTPGVMHACGHDGHAAMQLAAAQILAGEREQLHGEVRFLFQHAEELPPGGAVEDGEGRCDGGRLRGLRHAPELQFPHRHLRRPGRCPHQRHGPF